MTKKRKSFGKVLADGEMTGHAHRVTVDVYEGAAPETREFDGATTVTHEEHKPITLPDGEWVSGQVQEFDYLEQALRTVRD